MRKTSIANNKSYCVDKSVSRGFLAEAAPLLLSVALVIAMTAGAAAQAGGDTTSKLSPPAGSADSKLLARCNQLADAAQMRGKPRDTWIAGCIKRKGEPEDSSQSNPTVGGAPMMADKSIVENASKTENLSTLVKAVKAAGLAETLSGDGPFTVFAPTDAAFEKLPAKTLEDLMKPENKDKLKAILTYHVVPTKATSEAVAGMIKDGGGTHKVKTVQGEEFTLKMDGEKLVVVDARGNNAIVTTADVMQSNGVVHVIDTVLMPKM